MCSVLGAVVAVAADNADGRPQTKAVLQFVLGVTKADETDTVARMTLNASVE
jgi:hypothetical protein